MNNFMGGFSSNIRTSGSKISKFALNKYPSISSSKVANPFMENTTTPEYGTIPEVDIYPS